MEVVEQKAAPTDQVTAGAAPKWLSFNYACTILVSAFLLFQVQPLISKFILPWFGGSPAVWTTCILFFQVVLFGGYAYAHLVQRFLSPKSQGILHLGLLVLAAIMLPITPSDAWKPEDSDSPTWRILSLLSVCVGVPYFVLSSTGPLVQAWFSRSYPGRSPYRLYALSNVGSLAALVSYPFIFEPALDVFWQARLWSGGFLLFAALCGFCAAWMMRLRQQEAASGTADVSHRAHGRSPGWSRRAAWIGLPACASLMLLATTNHVCQDVAVIPFLWVVPLSLYLLSFIICFDHERWYHRTGFAVATAITLFIIAGLYDGVPYLTDRIASAMALVFSLGMGGAADQVAPRSWRVSFMQELGLYFAGLFFVCMICHGELVKLKPNPRWLTEFYLMISAGGALGGIFVSLIAPRVFSTFVEWKIGLLISFFLAVAIATGLAGGRRRLGVLSGLVLLLAGVAVDRIVLWQWQTSGDAPIEVARNFYGVVSIWEADKDNPDKHRFSLRHGTIVHGRQYANPERRAVPLTYYSERSGVGQTLRYFNRQDRLRVGTVGLGVGTVATYIKPGQYVRFYEINPEVQRLADSYFTFLKDCRGKQDVVMGDARLSLEREPGQNFDVLVLDAFSGDAVPAHLLTKEAFEIYLRHMTAGGVIAVNITNQYLDLAPVMRALADHFELGLTRIYTPKDLDKFIYRSDWVLLTKNQEFLKAHPLDVLPGTDNDSRVALWTDHYSNLFDILKSR